MPCSCELPQSIWLAIAGNRMLGQMVVLLVSFSRALSVLGFNGDIDKTVRWAPNDPGYIRAFNGYRRGRSIKVSLMFMF